MEYIVRNFLYLFPLLPAVASAQIYLCKDAAGKTYTSDRPLMECAGRSIREYGSNGMLKREVPAPLTAEQKHQKQLEEEQRKADEVARLERQQADNALLARYRNEKDIAIARQRALEIVQDGLKRQASATAEAEKHQKDIQSKAARYKDGKPMPPALARRVEESEQAVRSERKKSEAIEAEVARINQKFDATLKRYQELRSSDSTGTR